MNADNVATYIKQARREYEGLVLRYSQRLSDLPRAEALLLRLATLPGAEDIHMVSISGDYTRDERTEVDLWLLVPASPFPREVVKALGITLHKSPGSDALTCKGEWDGMSLRIYGYLPESCAIVYEEVDVPARRELQPKVVCAGKGDLA